MLSLAQIEELKHALGDRVSFDRPLAPLLAYKVGGPADALVTPRSEEDLDTAREFAKRHGIPITVIGHGTNLLVLDGGIRGITVSLLDAFSEITLLENTPEKIRVRAGGGVLKPDLLNWAAEKGFQGLEFSSGVPGTIGGGIYMNAGTKYGSYGDILDRIRLYDFKSGARELSRHEAHFGYREQTAVKGSLVLWVDFILKHGDAEAIKSEIARIIAERAEKQPLDFPSCGSTFKNPPGLSAGRLVEKANLKGLKAGGAEISLKHANFILNKGNARAADILSLIKQAEARVKELFSVELEREVIVLGEP